MTRDDPSAFAPPPAFGPFRVLHQIGVGALGPVFRTYEPTRDRLIAVKVFRLDVTPEQAQLLADELSKAADAGLFHPSIVEPVAAGLEGTVAYRAEEYVAAESLDVAIRHYAPAPPDKVLPYVTQLAGAIDFARAAGVGHGALHLRDVFVTPEEARASGFGVVEALERVGLRAPVRRPYSAPERIAGAPWATPADVFSLAAITFELLTGRRPAGRGPEIGALNPEVAGVHHEALHGVLARGMDENPALRYPSALAFVSAVEAAARGERQTGAVAQVGAIAGAPPLTPDAGRDAVPLVEPDAAPEVPDDILGERDEDEIHYSIAETERARREARMDGASKASATGMLFDAEGYERDDQGDEAVEDLALGAAAGNFTDDVVEAPPAVGVEGRTGRAPGGLRSDAHPPYEAAADDSEYRGAALIEPPRTPMLPIALGVVLGLLVGFAGGYGVGSRSGADDVVQGTSATAPATGPGTETADSSVAGGREYSEQVLQPQARPSPPPDIPNEAPPADLRPANPVPVATSGSLVIQSTPSRAGVTVNGQWRGRTPLTLDEQPFRDYSIRVVQDGYEVATEQVTLSPDQPSQTVSLSLARQAAPPPAARPAPPRPAPTGASRFLGSIYVDSRPRGARVVIDGKSVGTTPLRLPEVGIGSHVVRLELENHRVWTTSTRVQSGQETRVTGSLEPIR